MHELEQSPGRSHRRHRRHRRHRGGLVLALFGSLLVVGVGQRADAWETRTHQQITEAAWQYIKGKASGDPAFGSSSAYPTRQDCQRAVTFFQNLRAQPCGGAKTTCVYAFPYIQAGTTPDALFLSSYEYNQVSTPDGYFLTRNAELGGESTYVPAIGVLAKNELLFSGWGGRIDYTGTVLGYYAGYGDYVNDTFGLLRDPEGLQKIRDALDEGLDWGTVIVGAGCGMLGIISWPFGAACGGILAAGATWSRDKVEEALNRLPETYPTPYIDGHTLTAFWHFHPIKPHLPTATGVYDDVDGFSWYNSRDHAEHFEGGLLNFVFGVTKVGLSPAFSNVPIDQYHIVGDGHRDTNTARLDPDYWRHLNTLYSATYMPSDNMLRANWDNWFRLHGRSGVGAEYDLTFLGLALHAIQDASSAPHFAGALNTGNHQEYERHVRDFFDIKQGTQTIAGQIAEASGRPTWPDILPLVTVMNWAGTKGQENLNAISSILVSVIEDEINNKATKPTHQYVYGRNDLPVRDISFRLTTATGDSHLLERNNGTIVLPYEQRRDFGDWSRAGQVAIQHAIAGTVALLVHASRTDVEWESLGGAKHFNGEVFDPQDIDGDGVGNHRDSCPVTGRVMEGAQLLFDVGPDGCPDPDTGDVSLYSLGNCLREALAGATNGYFAGSTDAETTVDAGIQAIGGCEALAYGTATVTLEERVQARRQAWVLTKNFLASGDKLAYRKEEACLQASYPALFPEAPSTASQLCECTLDADGDGVSDCDDECPGTPEHTEVDAMGCSAAAVVGG